MSISTDMAIAAVKEQVRLGAIRAQFNGVGGFDYLANLDGALALAEHGLACRQIPELMEKGAQDFSGHLYRFQMPTLIERLGGLDAVTRAMDGVMMVPLKKKVVAENFAALEEGRAARIRREQQEARLGSAIKL